MPAIKIFSDGVADVLTNLRRDNTIYSEIPYIYDFAEFLAEQLPDRITGREFMLMAKHALAEIVCARNNTNFYETRMDQRIDIPEKYSSLTRLQRPEYEIIYKKLKELAILSLGEKPASEAHYFWSVEG